MRKFNMLATSVAVALSGAVVSMGVAAQKVELQDHGLGGEVTPQIVGGAPANTAEWPFYTQILNSNGTTAFCGGSYIGDGFVLTAAHCVNAKAAQFIDVKVAGFVLNGNDGDRIRVAQKYVHPQYNSSTLNHDIALLKLERLPRQGQAVQIASGSLSQYARNGDLLTVAGLGRLSEGGSRPSVLHEVDVPLVSDAVCQQSGGSYANVGDVAFCAGYAVGEKDSCSGDSGGPIVVRSGGQIVQLGAVSWGVGCARPAKYGVYADVAALRGWIDSIKLGGGSASLTYKPTQTLADFALYSVVSHRFDLRNSGTKAANLNAVVVSASGVASGLVVTADTCSNRALSVNQSCSVNVEFTAQQAGTAGVSFAFTEAASTTQHSATVTAQAIDKPACAGSWNENSIYQKPDRVTYNGKVYEAKWWTQGERPGTASVWLEVGVDSSCN
ncbi:trypsin-like serine protease [Pseudoalteromonas fenneropenaei]|uniref:Trypsin-like serine protease n=1 Tax=Pseudoalteromonas fenneropenaei TaxID=1737459 RepID=A0ABV7CED8_9GAMM